MMVSAFAGQSGARQARAAHSSPKWVPNRLMTSSAKRDTTIHGTLSAASQYAISTKRKAAFRSSAMPSPFEPRDWTLAHGRSLGLGSQGVIMAIINVTPDSFSDGGVNLKPDIAVGNAIRAAKAGAAIVDIGGESTRPNAAEVS